MLRAPPRSTLFPTRRSSDLGVIRTGRWRRTRREELRPGGRSAESVCMRDHPNFIGRRSTIGRAPAEGDHEVVRGIDRKSTRLNSSHVEISYAVFCLKKKIDT